MTNKKVFAIGFLAGLLALFLCGMFYPGPRAVFGLAKYKTIRSVTFDESWRIDNVNFKDVFTGRLKGNLTNHGFPIKSDGDVAITGKLQWINIKNAEGKIAGTTLMIDYKGVDCRDVGSEPINGSYSKTIVGEFKEDELTAEAENVIRPKIEANLRGEKIPDEPLPAATSTPQSTGGPAASPSISPQPGKAAKH